MEATFSQFDETNYSLVPAAAPAASNSNTKRFRKRVVGVTPSVELVISEVSSTADECVWRLYVEALNVAVRCTVPVSSRALANPFSSVQVAHYMADTYFSRFPLFSRLALGHRLQVSNATAEAGVRILKHDERALPHKPSIQLRLDEYIQSRIATRVAQCRLLVTRVKSNLLRIRKRKAAEDLTATHTWSQSPSLTLSAPQRRLHQLLVDAVQWRRRSDKATLETLVTEITAAAPDDAKYNVEGNVLAGPTLSKIINGHSWPSIEVERALEAWVHLQVAAMAKQMTQHASTSTSGATKPDDTEQNSRSRRKRQRKTVVSASVPASASAASSAAGDDATISDTASASSVGADAEIGQTEPACSYTCDSCTRNACTPNTRFSTS